MANHVSAGIPVTLWVASPTRGSALRCAYAGAGNIPSNNAATPRKKGPRSLTGSRAWSSEHSVQEPTVRLRALTENPQLHAVDVECRVVIASNIASIPPTCLDSLDIAYEAECAAAAR